MNQAERDGDKKSRYNDSRGSTLVASSSNYSECIHYGRRHADLSFDWTDLVSAHQRSILTVDLMINGWDHVVLWFGLTVYSNPAVYFPVWLHLSRPL
ncbi:hypothetical protein IEQ34_017187 [Dendrobium chrysotoxum]|uniref:Uncharacterized protein n=1 Tax=Dendrobium chrysotoxum TaxID=161865 RepID=A0AAV7GAZ1_DENCH|nr:hypothetical protein IEQ34_017187 [Dendrobium chrysotoxum]